jgi:hypothetical protein
MTVLWWVAAKPASLQRRANSPMRACTSWLAALIGVFILHENNYRLHAYDERTIGAAAAGRDVGIRHPLEGESRRRSEGGYSCAIPVEACSLGWQESLSLLASLVEAEIPSN